MLWFLMILQIVLVFISFYLIFRAWVYQKRINKVYEEAINIKKEIEIHGIKIRLIRLNLERRERQIK